MKKTISLIYKGIVVLLVLLVTITCNEAPNNDVFEEISCSEADGTWLVSKVLCNGDQLDNVPFSSVRFEEADMLRWKVGSAECQSSVDNVYQLQQSELDLFGLSFFSCSTNGAETDSCSGQQTQCNSSKPGSTHTQNFPVCVISFGALKLSRIVTEDHLTHGQNFCPEVGQVEEILYTQQTATSASLTFSTGFGYGFPSLLPGEFLTETITVTNVGPTPATDVRAILETPFAFPGNGSLFPGDGGSCTDVIPPESTCTMVVQFFATEVGPFSQNVEFRFNNGGGDVSTFFLVSGTVEQPLANVNFVDSPPIDFETQVAGSTTLFPVAFENSGTGAAKNFRITNPLPPFYISGGEFPGTNGSCNKVILKDEVCIVEYEFRPEGPGTFSMELQMSYNNGNVELLNPFEIMGTAVSADP